MKAFTLLEIVIVVIIMGIITLMVMVLSGNQLQKLQWESVKSSLLAEYQLRYSKNLTSSVLGGESYDQMQISFASGNHSFTFAYLSGVETVLTGTFQGDFQIKSIIPDPLTTQGNLRAVEQLTLSFMPYQIFCGISGEDWPFSEVGVVIEVKKQKLYYFIFSSKNCRMREVEERLERLPEWVS